MCNQKNTATLEFKSSSKFFLTSLGNKHKVWWQLRVNYRRVTKLVEICDETIEWMPMKLANILATVCRWNCLKLLLLHKNTIPSFQHMTWAKTGWNLCLKVHNFPKKYDLPIRDKICWQNFSRGCDVPHTPPFTTALCGINTMKMTDDFIYTFLCCLDLSFPRFCLYNVS